MKHLASIIVVVFAVVMLFTSCAIHISKREEASGNMTTKTYNVTSFKGIDAEPAINIVYTVSDSISIKAEGHENDLKHINITVDSDSILHISSTVNGSVDTDTHVINLFSHGNNINEIKIYISGPALSSLNLEGASDFTCKGVMKSPSMDIEVSGASKIKMDSLETTSFKTTTEGASKIEIGQVKAQTVSMETSGAGKVNVGLVNVDNTIFSTEGAGMVNALFDNCNTAKVSVSGAGKVELSGKLHNLDRVIVGVADIDYEKLKIE